MKRSLAWVLLLVLTSIGFAQAQTKITGKVTDPKTGEAIPFVSVLLNESPTIGTNTDASGNYTLEVPENAKTLRFTAVGYDDVLEPINNRTTINVGFSQAATRLDEAIVVAYGMATKRSFTGSVTSVKAESIQKIQSANAVNALEGTASGVQITSSTGQPGSDPQIRIRGIGSINASKQPLYVVDGAFYDGPISSINPADIESMNVLKDAAASSLYGARGANGVILITTKRNNRSAMGINFDAKWGINSRATPEYDYITDRPTYYEQAWLGQYNKLAPGRTHDQIVNLLHTHAKESFKNRLGGYNNYNVEWNDLIDPATGKFNPSAQPLFTDKWEDALFQNSLRQEYNLNLGGSDAKQSYYIGLGYLDDESYAKGSGYDRMSGRLKYERKITDWLKVGASMAYTHSDQQSPSLSESSSYTNYFQWVRHIAPIYPVYLHDPVTGAILSDARGKMFDYGNNPELGYLRPYASKSNPAGVLDYDIRQFIRDNVSGNVFFNADLYKGLSVDGNYSFNTNFREYKTTQNPFYGDAADQNGRAVKQIDKETSYTASGFLRYKTTFGEDLTMDAMAGSEVYNYSSMLMSGSKSGLAISDVPELSNAAVMESLNSYSRDYSVLGILGRVNFDYKGKYFVSGSIRRDASSKFHPDNRWGTFWSVGASWIMSNENFMKDIKTITDVKVKTSIGTQGNDGILYDKSPYNPNYKPYIDQYEVANNNGEVSVKRTFVGNKDLTWEKNLNFNAGIEFRLVDRVNVGFDYFYKKTTDMLFNQPVPVSTGVKSMPANIGSMRNSGIEVEIGVDIIQSDDWNFNMGINLTHFSNKVLSIPEDSRENGLAYRGYTKLYEGGSVYDIYLSQYAGVNNNGQALYRKYAEDGSFTEGIATQHNDLSRKNAGKAIADFFGGINMNLSWKQIDLGAIFSYQVGGKAYDAIYAASMGMGEYGRSMHKDQLNAWTPENTSSNIPQFVYGNSTANAASDRFIVSTSFFNIRNISLGYTFPKAMLAKLHIDRLRVYAVADNLWLFSAKKGFDPRQFDYGYSSYNYSPIRTVSFGFNLGF